MPRFKAGGIVIVDWRGGALPKEPNRLRPAVVVEDVELFDAAYPNVIVVPLTGDARLAIPGLAVTIDPTPDNGCEQRCFALAPSVTSVSVRHVRETESHIQPDQLDAIRRRIAEAIGVS
jgi:mRNA-degrading endonuclease toxin of MazEF toxin-antitoxin module